MRKEIQEQPSWLVDILEGRIGDGQLLDSAFGIGSEKVLDQVKAVQIIACGTSYHAGLVARYWLEAIAGVPCRVEVASEYRYRKTVLMDDTLVVTISQSDETADTLAALRAIKELTDFTLSVCNVPESSLVRESKLKLMTRTGQEIGVASTKAFTTQLTSLLITSVAIAVENGLSAEREKSIVQAMRSLPVHVNAALLEDAHIKKIADRFANKHNALFLGRGTMFPIALARLSEASCRVFLLLLDWGPSC